MEALSVPLRERLLAGRLDAAVVHNPTPSPLLNIEPMLTESLCLLSPAQGASSRAVPFQALEQFELIFPGAPHPIRSSVKAEAQRRGMKLRVVLEIDAIGMSLQPVAQGFGPALVPNNVLRAGMSGPGIVARPIVRPSLSSTLALITPARRPTTLLADGIAEVLRQVLRQTLLRSSRKR